jgi:hypothetical protein
MMRGKSLGIGLRPAFVILAEGAGTASSASIASAVQFRSPSQTSTSASSNNSVCSGDFSLLLPNLLALNNFTISCRRRIWIYCSSEKDCAAKISCFNSSILSGRAYFLTDFLVLYSSFSCHGLYQSLLIFS